MKTQTITLTLVVLILSSLSLAAGTSSNTMSQGDLQVVVNRMAEARNRLDTIKTTTDSLSQAQDETLAKEDEIEKSVNDESLDPKTRERLRAEGLKLTADRLVKTREALRKTDAELAKVQFLLQEARVTIEKSPIIGNDPAIELIREQTRQLSEEVADQEGLLFDLLARDINNLTSGESEKYGMSQDQLFHAREASQLLRQQVDGGAVVDYLDNLTSQITAFRFQVDSASAIADEQIEFTKTVAVINATTDTMGELGGSLDGLLNRDDPIGMKRLTRSSPARWLDKSALGTGRSTTTGTASTGSGLRSLRQQGF